MKKKLIGLVIGLFSISIVSASAATELKLATFEPQKHLSQVKFLQVGQKRLTNVREH